MMEEIRLTDEERREIRRIFYGLDEEQFISNLMLFLTERFNISIEIGPMNLEMNDFTSKRNIFWSGQKLRAAITLELVNDLQAYGHIIDASSEMAELVIGAVIQEVYRNAEFYMEKAVADCYKKVYENIKPCALLN